MNNGSLTDLVKTINLTVGQLCNTQRIDEWIFAEAPKVRAEYVLETSRLMLYSMVQYAEQKCEPVIYPADWWQAVKQRFAPAWCLKRWPVKLTVWEPFVIYPDIKLPERQHYVKIRRLSEIPSWQD